MKIMELRGSFGLENLVAGERPKPSPGPGEVLLKMKAASINYRDLLMVQGLYNLRQALPLIPCSDGVGEVVAVGEGVSRFAKGDRVATLFCQNWVSGEPSWEKLHTTLGGPLDGTLAEYMVLPEQGLVAVPQHLSDEEAATLTCAGLTAWSALVTQANLEPGDTVLVLGTGGVSIFALQFARILGLEAIITSSSDEKLSRALEMGASQGINYLDNPAWGKRVKELTNRRGVDLVIEVGGGKTLEESIGALRIGGQISLIGVLAGNDIRLPVTSILMRHLRIQGVLVGHRKGFEAMNRAVAESDMHPVVDRTFPVHEIREALSYLGSARHFGKVCLRH